MTKDNPDSGGNYRKALPNRRDILRSTGTMGLAAMTIPSSAIAQSEEESQGHDHDYEDQNSSSDYLTQIIETETYIVTKSTRGDGVTYLKEFTEGEKVGQIHVSTFEEEVISEDGHVEEPLIPEEEKSNESTTDSDGSLSLHSDDECTSPSGGWEELILATDSINESIGEDCEGRGIDDDAYGDHRYHARSVSLSHSVAAICTAELTNIITYLLEPLGIPQIDRAVSYAVGALASWTTREVTIGGIDYDGSYSSVPYVSVQGAREFSADHDELSSFGSVPGHLEL